jgi:hypothetical protein
MREARSAGGVVARFRSTTVEKIIDYELYLAGFVFLILPLTISWLSIRYVLRLMKRSPVTRTKPPDSSAFASPPPVWDRELDGPHFG